MRTTRVAVATVLLAVMPACTLAMSALEAACREGDRRACDGLGIDFDDAQDGDEVSYEQFSDGAMATTDEDGRALSRDEHVQQKGSRAYLEDGGRQDYDPETCLVYSEAFAVVRSPECVAEKLQDYFAEDGGPSTFFYAERAFCSD